MRHRPNALMLFAAGFGTRMGALTTDMPKPLIPVAGKPLIDHTLDAASGCEFEKVIANLHYLPEQLENHLHPKGIETLRETPDILETGGGLKNALPVLGKGPVVTSNTDAIWSGPSPFDLALDAWNPDLMDALLVCVPLMSCIGHAGQGDFVMDQNGKLTRGSGDVVFGGVQILKTDHIHQIKEASFSLNIVWDQMLSSNRLYGVTYPGTWCDVGHPEGIVLAENMLRSDNV